MQQSNHFADFSETYLVAEIGVNHNGDLALARELVLAAKEAGADAVKFQTFLARTLVGPGTPKVSYQERTTASSESHYEMIERLELSRSSHHELYEFCNEIRIDFLSTPYDVSSAEFLVELGVKYIKIASADIVDIYLHEYLAGTSVPTIIATGMATPFEISQALDIYRDKQHTDVILLHCVSNYPCSDLSLNLRAMVEVGSQNSLPFGFSDHSVGSIAAVAAVAMGAVVVEKHFTLDKNLPGPDHLASVEPSEFRQLVENIRRVEMILGSREKRCAEEERQMASVSRKSLVAARPLPKGTLLTPDDLTTRRPGTGILPLDREHVLGRILNADVAALESITWTHLA